ncbi:hypothetical protein C0Q70_18877 [Pomacea canaliculata]|uniref:Sodium-dependent phosphate transport protein 2B n=1 Tax=Pomacea canaliculata TaxID=400727 RepID=A0A2T7NHU9_POMCA|nr:hypothetical protein C0Q70_18877 [Pomacea canaliculata]
MKRILTTDVVVAGKAAGEAMTNTVLFSNPIAGLMLGILCTVLVQSSSTSTSIMVSMVSSDILDVRLAIFMIMGANIGTTVTNTIVALGQAGDRGDFRRAFAAATVHDMFNWLSVLVLLPLEWASGYLFHLTKAIVGSMELSSGAEEQQFLKVITQPLTDRVVKLSSSKIRDIAKGIAVNGSLISEGEHIFNNWSGSDEAAGGILLAASLVLLCVCLILVVKLLSTLLRGTIAKILRRIVNYSFAEPFDTLIGFVFMAVGAGLTILVQSSSVFTSALTPLVGMGAIHVDKMYTLTLGSNIGTTITGILAALASSPSGFRNSFQVALCHLFFNISGIVLWYPVPFMRRTPLKMAKYLGDTVFIYRWFSGVYLVAMFFILPLAVFGLSLAGWELLLGVGAPIILLIVFVVIVNLIRSWKPHVLPARLQSWEALPLPLRSLQPYDRLFQACMCCKKDTDKPKDSTKL